MVHISRALAIPAGLALLAVNRPATAQPAPSDEAFAVAGAQGFGLRSAAVILPDVSRTSIDRPARGRAARSHPDPEPPNLRFGSGDDFKLDLRTALATDARVFLGDRPAGVNDRSTAAVRTAALQLDATVYAKLRVLMLANAIDPRAPVTDAWADLAIDPALHVRVGKFPFPISSERLTPPLSQPFVGSSAAGLLLPARDTGLQVYGSWRALDWNLALVNGALANQPGDADTDGGKELVARAFVYPLGRAPGRELGLGVGASWGRHHGTSAAPGLTSLRSYGGQTFFAYRSDPATAIVADGELIRVVPHATIAAGPLGVQLDGVLAWEDVANTRVAMRAASAIATVALTGEPARPLAFVVPRHPVHGPDPGPGAILVAAGAGGVRIDHAAFTTAADPAAAASRFTVLGGGVKWYPVAGNRRVRRLRLPVVRRGARRDGAGDLGHAGRPPAVHPVI